MPREGQFPGIDEEFLKNGATKITDRDIEMVNSKFAEIRSEFEKRGPLQRFVEDAKLLFSVVRDYWKGEYKKIPWWAISAIVFTLLYVFNPFDIIPDVLPVIGYVDDASVFAVCLALVEQQLLEYRQWKMG